VADDVDPHDQVEPKDRVAEGLSNRGIDHLGRLAAQGRPGRAGGLPGEPVDRERFRKLVQQGLDIGVEIPEGVGLVQPGEDALGGRERGLEDRQP
jgi:hypothetical protein